MNGPYAQFCGTCGLVLAAPSRTDLMYVLLPSIVFLHFVFKSLPPDIVNEGVMFSGCPSTTFVRPFVHSSGQILLPRYLMNGLSNLDETYGEYSLAPTDDLVRFWRSEVKVTVGHRGGKVIYVDAGASKSI